MTPWHSLTSRPSNPPIAGGAALISSELEIRVVQLSKSFDGKSALTNIDLEIHRGELVAIIGRSGSGKTTLLRHLTGHFQPDRGSVSLADHEQPGSPLVDLATISPEQLLDLARHFGVVFQENGLLAGPVYDALALPFRLVENLDEADIHTKVIDALTAVGLDAESVSKIDVDALSGGMAKRVATAAALARDPILIFYDEPTSGLDPETSWQIQNLIRTVHDRPTTTHVQRTSVIITHDKELLARLHPRTVILEAGRLIFDGPYKSFQLSKLPEIEPYLRDALADRAVPIDIP